ncbi:hypothetical protein [Pectobacterium versatile]|uniref:hypothetical protein n=1 Tax=Pectobacterium versatile TaxID=2488639 RepID=UPI001B39F567|nr:hypothetical protein [Pectobacterium versatile]
MSEFFGDYRGAFKLRNVIGLKRWIYFSLKSVLLFLLLLLLFSLFQYMVIFYTPLYEYVTAPGVKLSSIYGLILMLAVSFGPSLLYLIRIIIQSKGNGVDNLYELMKHRPYESFAGKEFTYKGKSVGALKGYADDDNQYLVFDGGLRVAWDLKKGPGLSEINQELRLYRLASK